MTSSGPRKERLDWGTIRDRIDLTTVATGLLGPAAKRSGRRLLWRCPFHDDHDPSFQVDPTTQRWKCWPCDRGGDAPALVMAIERVEFPEAVRRLADRAGIVGPSGRPVKASWSGAREPEKPKPKPKAEGFSKPREPPSGMSAGEAMAIVEEAERRLWTPEGASALDYLKRSRGLTEATIRRHRLGWTKGQTLPTSRADRFFRVSGVVIPWFDGGRLRLVKIRQPEGATLRYVEAFRDGASVYPGPSSIRPGTTLVVVEGEFEAMLLGQEIGDLASVATFGGASGRPDQSTRLAMAACPIRIAAHDADGAGDRAAVAWSEGAERATPPAGKDWTDAWRSGIDLRRWWIDNHLRDDYDAEERAAIMEYDGGLTRAEAERLAGTIRRTATERPPSAAGCGGP